MQLIADPSAILRRNPLFAAMIRSAAELRNTILQVETRDQTQKEIDTQTADRQRASLAAQRDAFNTYYQHGNLSPDDEATRKQFAAEFDALLSGQNAA